LLHLQKTSTISSVLPGFCTESAQHKVQQKPKQRCSQTTGPKHRGWRTGTSLCWCRGLKHL